MIRNLSQKIGVLESRVNSISRSLSDLETDSQVSSMHKEEIEGRIKNLLDYTQNLEKEIGKTKLSVSFLKTKTKDL